MKLFTFSILILPLLHLCLFAQPSAQKTLIFGAISPIETELMQKKLTPLIEHLEKVTQHKIVFKSGYSYQDTVDKFSDGRFDIGFIGASPYIRAQEKNPDALELLAQIQNEVGIKSKSVIFVKKGSLIDTLDALQGKSFAFGSKGSTLSYYVPMSILLENNITNRLQKYHFLGKHDKVAEFVIMGKYDAGAVKKSVAQRYATYIQPIASSEDFPEFAIVAQKSLDKDLRKKIKEALFALQETQILKSIQSSAIGFKEIKDSDYDKLRVLMKRVDDHIQK